jgi:S1-C subfamily serine protease
MKRTFALLTVLAVLALACSGYGIAAPSLSPADTPMAIPTDTLAPTATETLAAPPLVEIPAGIVSGLADLYERVNPGVVAIFAYGRDESSVALGSGFIVDMDGHILTNLHVVNEAELVEVDFPSSLMTEAEIVAEDPDSDLAVLHVDVAAEELTPLTLGDSSQVRVGDTVIAIGNPYGLYSTLTLGIVSAKGRTDESLRETNDSGYYLLGDMIQTDAAINPGNSGGPLLNMKGEVIGVNRSIRTESVTESGNVVNSGLGFAISSNIVRRILPSLISKGKYDYPYLGLTGLSEMHLKTVQLLGLPYSYGVYITNIIPGGPADQAGLRAGLEEIPEVQDLMKGGDLIIAVDGQTIHDFAEMISIIVLTGTPGDTLTFTVSRDGQTLDIPVVLGVRS